MKKFRVLTTKPVAFDSPDHITPCGTLNDNSVNLTFNARLYSLLEAFNLPISVLDIGCSGGGMVKSLIDDNRIAVGIEGSDASQKIGRAEWATIPDFLFTADVTVPFRVEEEVEGEWKPFRFSCVTAWEVMEHFKEDDLGAVLENMTNHLAPGGYFICSVFTEPDPQWERWHQTVKPWDWWVKRLAEAGLTYGPNATKHFQHQFVRVGVNGVFKWIL